MEHNPPSGVKTVSILYYVGGALALLAALFVFAGSGLLAEILASATGAGIIGTIGTVFGVGLLLVALVDFVLGWGLWSGNSAARVVAIIFAAIAGLSALFSLLGGDFVFGLIGVLVYGWIAYYLSANDRAKTYFKTH